MTSFETRVRQDPYEIYTRLDDEQSGRQLLVGRLNMLFRDRRAHARTARLMETEARMSREAWGRSMDASDLARTEVIDAGGRSQEAEAAHRGTEADKVTSDSDGRVQEIAGTCQRSCTPANTQEDWEAAMIDQGVTAVLAAGDANTNGIDSHNSGTGTEGVVELTQWIEKWKLTVGNDIAYAMTWTKLKKKMTDKYYPRTEIKKLKVELMFPEESDKIEKYVGSLPDMIHESLVAPKPKTMQEATEMAIEVMDKRIRTFADRTVEKKQYGVSKPLCSKCNYHHDGPCAPKCHKCNKVGHFARDCRSMGHFKRECPKLENNNNRGNQGGNGSSLAKVYAVGHAWTDPDSNIVTGTFLQNNRYASVLFDTGADRSFVSTAFSSQIDITPSTLDHY
ncbi:putative reverse transcriptase domain-containing protein [Tanacetum coccineum]